LHFVTASMANPRASRAAISREAVSKFMWDSLLRLPEKPLGRPMARDNPVTIPLRCGSLGAAEFFHLALEGFPINAVLLLLGPHLGIQRFAQTRQVGCDGER